MQLHHYTTSGNKDLILDFIDRLPLEQRAAGLMVLEKLQNNWQEALFVLPTRQLREKLWEVKFYKDNRIFYIVMNQENIYLLHACKKQKGKAEKFELDKALQRAKELNFHAL